MMYHVQEHKMRPEMGWDITQNQDTITLGHPHTAPFFTLGHHHTGNLTQGHPHTSVRNFRVSNSVATVIMLTNLMLIVGKGAANIILGQFFFCCHFHSYTKEQGVLFQPVAAQLPAGFALSCWWRFDRVHDGGVGSADPALLVRVHRQTDGGGGGMNGCLDQEENRHALGGSIKKSFIRVFCRKNLIVNIWF